jgi:hypothetical protein
VEALRRELAELRAELEALKAQVRQVPPKGEEVSRTGVELQEAWLGQNIPNPFDETTRIPYAVPAGVSQAELHIRSADGRTIAVIPLRERGARGELVLRMRDYATGAYEYALVLDGRTVASRQMLLLK